jgi:hypothetical protein
MSALYKTSNVAKTPYCDVCYKKGKPESVYTSHYPKSVPGPNGITTCPTILAAVCNYCGQNGHWANEKFCSAMRKDAKRSVVAKQLPVQEEKKKKVENIFEALRAADDDVVFVPDVVVHKEKKALTSWADIAKKPPALVSASADATIYYTSKNTEPIMTPAEREAYKILMERRASGYFDIKRENFWNQDEEEDDEEEEYGGNEEYDDGGNGGYGGNGGEYEYDGNSYGDSW